MMAERRRRRRKASTAELIAIRIDQNIRSGLVAPGERQLGIDAAAAKEAGMSYGQYITAKQARRMRGTK